MTAKKKTLRPKDPRAVHHHHLFANPPQPPPDPDMAAGPVLSVLVERTPLGRLTLRLEASRAVMMELYPFVEGVATAVTQTMARLEKTP